ncbi:NAD(P)-dependent alcohol dehydrogenase [Methanomassiliicoccus luminyensis]|uniref:NAD(P)-dependent alcohol dehydrogenase n=1 Tax=Methanomassiliicoccus luminyensis TaxID=1080712 RepID=UPI000376B7DE|nr:NAD(P)-dependent alcohol dehydrogenase [Methanomassiliicoccus luminyensis]
MEASGMMRAIVSTRYGNPETLQLMEVERPVPVNNEVLVKVHAASLNKSDWYMMTGKPFLVRMMAGGRQKKGMRGIGSDLAGVVEAVGENARRFKLGNEVFGNTSVERLGSCAEYVCVPEEQLAPKPCNISLEEAAAAPLAGMTALQGLRGMGHIGPGKKVLVHGASGGVGTFAVQIARAFGAEVDAVTSPRHVDAARHLGAGRVIDYTREDFTADPRKYDIVFVANGSRSVFDYWRALNPGGVCIVSGGSMAQFAQAGVLGPFASLGNRKIRLLSEKNSQEDLAMLKDMLEEGAVVSIIDKSYLLSEVPQAMTYLGQGHSGGKIVITVP